jgi:hypothetical protein
VLTEKAIIGELITVLKDYECYEEAARFAWVIPNTRELYQLSMAMLKPNNRKENIQGFVAEVC